MTVRDYIIVLPHLDPRIVRVLAPNIEATIQDIHDTLRAWEDSPDGQPYDIIIDSAGKQDLGGGVSVGISATLQNALLEFEERADPDVTGTVTTADVLGITLTDATATFISDGIVAGAYVTNCANGASGTVRQILSETQLTVERLVGAGTDWGLGDDYLLWNVARCSVSGGNLVAVDEFQVTQPSPIHTSFGTMVTLTSSASATLQNLSAIEYASFNGGVTVDVTSPYSGTLNPVGTPEFPVNNMVDANAIADGRGFTKFYVNGDITLSAVDFSDGHIFHGQSESLTTITIDAGANVSNCEFQNATVTGTLDGGNTIRDCLISTVSVINGLVVNCGLSGTVTLGAGTLAEFINCYSGVAGGSTPTIDLGGTGNSLLVRGYRGGLALVNKTGTDACSIDLDSGQVVLDNTLTGGTIIIRGVGKPKGTTGGTIIEDEMLYPERIVQLTWDEPLTGATHNVTNSAGKRLRDLASQVIAGDNAQGPGTGPNQIQLAAGEPAVDGTYDPSAIFIRGGTGVGQTRNILQYDGASKTATVDRNWKVLPDATSEYVIFADAGREHVNEGLAQGGSANTITLNALASSADDVYVSQTIFIRSGTGDDQIAVVTAYNGTTKVATVHGPAADGAWATIPDSTSAYVMRPTHDNVAVEQFTAYGSIIVIDAANGTNGTTYPVGTRAVPVKTLADALVLSAKYGIEVFRVVGVFVVGPTDTISGLVFEGSNELVDTMVLSAGCTTQTTIFRTMRLTGVFNGGVFLNRVALQAVSGIGDDVSPSLFDECIFLNGTHTFKTGLTTPQNVQMINCGSGIGTVVFDANGGTTALGVRKYTGDMTVANYTGGITSELGFGSGSLTLDASCTSGTVKLGGSIENFTNNSTLTIVRPLLSRIFSLAKAIFATQ